MSVDDMSGGARAAYLQDEALQQQLPYLRELGVHHRYQTCKDGREGRRGHLGLHQAPAEQAPAALQVLHARAPM